MDLQLGGPSWRQRHLLGSLRVQLVDGAGPAASRHEALLVVAIQAGRARRAIRQAGGRDDGVIDTIYEFNADENRELMAAKPWDRDKDYSALEN